MKRIIIVLCALVAVCSCNEEASRIVSEKRIDASVLGCTVGDAFSGNSLKDAYGKAFSQDVRLEHQSSEGVEMVRASLGPDSEMAFAGCPWKYEDIFLSGIGNVYGLSFENAFSSRRKADLQLKKAVELFSSKYGEANMYDSGKVKTYMWTDDTNSVGVTAFEDKDADDVERWRCVLYYVNIELAGSVQASASVEQQ